MEPRESQEGGRKATGRGAFCTRHHAVTAGVARLPARSSRAGRLSILGGCLGGGRGGVESSESGVANGRV
jgi:hypothetical protein